MIVGAEGKKCDEEGGGGTGGLAKSLESQSTDAFHQPALSMCLDSPS